MKADLHLHSTFSDGVLTPEELVCECAKEKIAWMSVTDHDTFDGSDRLCSDSTAVPVIPGVELSTKDSHGLHLLGYGFTEASSLRKKVTQLSMLRVDRAKNMLRRLEQLGMPLDWELLLRQCGGSIGRPHIARAMVRAGYVENMQEAFARFLCPGCAAYVSCERLSMKDALTLLRENGFIPVLAHPRELKLEDHLLLSLIQKWKEQGLMGVEVYHPSARSSGFEGLDRMVRRLGLLVTGGSDFHQANDKHGTIGTTCDSWLSCEEDISALLDALHHEKDTCIE